MIRLPRGAEASSAQRGTRYAQSITGHCCGAGARIGNIRELLDRTQWPTGLLFASWRRVRLHGERQQEVLRWDRQPHVRLLRAG